MSKKKGYTGSLVVDFEGIRPGFTKGKKKREEGQRERPLSRRREGPSWVVREGWEAQRETGRDGERRTDSGRTEG